jgi:hypothetical protein
VTVIILSRAIESFFERVPLESELLQKLADKKITRNQLLETVESDLAILPIIVSGVSSSKATVRYSCAAVLVSLSEKQPAKLYPYMDFFASLLDSKHRILKWNGMAAIANLCRVDADKKFDAIFDKYYGFLGDEYMVTVATVVANSAKIARAKPYLVPRITTELLRVGGISTTPHLTEECTRVIAEKAIETFEAFYDLMSNKEKAAALTFANKHVKSTRLSLKNTAEIFLKKRAL